ncbi:MAG: head GIN domain-containing protein [Ginsengibacter sp.]
MQIFKIILGTAIIFAGCNVGGKSVAGNGNVKTETRNISGFTGVKSSGSIDVVITQGTNFSVSVENDENLIPLIVTEVRDGILVINYKDEYNINDDHSTVTVTAPEINKVAVSGSADIKTTAALKSDKEISFAISGSGNITANVNAPSVKFSGSGSGDISLDGNTKDFTCKMSGSGEIKCGNLKAENVDLSISGSSDAKVFASVSLKARVSGSGDVIYYGNPQNPEIHVAGSGTVTAGK